MKIDILQLFFFFSNSEKNKKMELIQAGKYLGSGIATVGLVGAGVGVGVCFWSFNYVSCS